VTIPRDIYSQGVDFVTYVHIAQLVVCIVFCIICILLVKNLVLTRLTALSGAVNEIGLKGDMSSRVTVSGKDELSRLAKNINGMLESLEKSESRRESQKELIGHIITNTPVAVLAVDGADTIVLFNDALISMFDLTDIDMFNKKVADIPRLSILIPEINSFKNSGAASSIGELTYVLDGINRTAIASFARLHEEETYILLLTDISEERARQETLYMTDRLASIGEMASGIAHELNNPLTSIIGLSEIIAMENVPDTVKEDMNIIKSESQRAADIVKNLLSFGRKNTSQKQPMAVNKIIQDVLRLRSYEHGVNNIKVIKELATDLPDIMADPSQIQQVIINLVLNAEQAMISAHDKGTITIRTQKVDNLVRITFSDDGPGIEPENLRHIFDPFFTTKETGKGTGLGLSISYGIVNEHNGKIYASSEPGKGATFVVELPLNDVGKKV
jgi:signal transduction histidine kinase/HAMP domain-containing protein